MATTKVSSKGVVGTVAATFQRTEPHLHPPTIIIFIIMGEEDKDIKEIATVLLLLLLLPLDLLDTKAREDMAWGEEVPKARVDMAPLELPKARVLVAVMVVEEEA
jgi:hypothetical protein